MAQRLLSQLFSLTWLWWLGILIWAGVLYSLSAQTSLPSGPDIPYMDKVLHFLYFSGGGFCFSLALLFHPTLSKSALRWWLMGTAFGALVGALDEYHQTFTPGRTGNDLGDWLADCTGAGAGALLAWLLVCWLVKPTLKTA